MTPEQADRAALHILAAVVAKRYDDLPQLGQTLIGNDPADLVHLVYAMAGVAAVAIEQRERPGEHLHYGVYL